MPQTKLPPSSNSKPASPPIASVAGLLTGCAVTLIGVLASLSPELILVRALIAGSMTFAVTLIFVSCWKHVSPQTDEE